MEQLLLAKNQAEAERSNPQRASVGSTEAKPFDVQRFEPDYDEELTTLRSARGGYELYEDDSSLINDYITWVEFPSVVLMQNDQTKAVFGVPASKRGNSVYRRRVAQRMAETERGFVSLNCKDGRTKTQVALVTLTYRPDILKPWERVGEDFNQFRSLIKRAFGGVKILRTWESTEKGAPHAHALIAFLDTSFKAKLLWSKKEKKFVVRLKRYKEIRKCWKQGHVDVRGVYDLKGAIGYLTKYLLKQLEGTSRKALLTLAKCWIYGKRSFSASRLDSPMHNKSMKSTSFDDEAEVDECSTTYTFLGVVYCSIVDFTKVHIHGVEWDDREFTGTKYSEPCKPRISAVLYSEHVPLDLIRSVQEPLIQELLP